MIQQHDLSQRRSQLSSAKQALLEKWAHGNLAPATRGIARRSESGPAPLSFSQERLWFLDQLVPGAAAYHMPILLRLVGQLKVEVLEQSLDEIVRRHESLRTSFTAVDGQPVQVIAPAQPLALPVTDLSALSEPEREARQQQLVADAVQQPFDLAQGSLIRVALLRLGEQEHVLLLVMHHIISDAWSFRVLIREVVALYEAFVMGRPSPLPELPIQYADFAAWQRQHLQTSAMESDLTYWKQKLSGPLPVLQLPIDRPRPPVQTHHGAWHYLELPEALIDALKALGQRESATLYMTLLAAFKTFLHRYTGQTDILVGTPIANRNRIELEGMIGFFVNTLALRTDLAGKPTFRELLGRVSETALEAFAHSAAPFEKVVEIVQPERSVSYTPVFQIMFILQNVPASPARSTDLTIQLQSVDSRTTQFDLTLEMSETASRFEYNTDLFDAATIARMAAQFEVLLHRIVANPDQRLSDLSLLSEAERQQLVVTWNDTRRPYPQDQCIHQLFEAQVERTPDAIAVVCNGQRLTYRELNRRANQVAHYLRARGVGPDVPVGVCMERSLEMIVAIYGILKAGGAYLPLDPIYPRERLAFMIADAQVPVLLTVTSGDKETRRQGDKETVGIEHLPFSPSPLLPFSGSVVDLVADREDIAQMPETNPDVALAPENLIYVIYTSGSTGKPKGVMIAHQSLVNHNMALARRFGFGPGDRVLQFASISFDAAAVELFPPLLSGATLVLRTERLLSFDRDFLRIVEQEQLTVLNLPTAYWHQWVDALTLAGERLPACLRLVHVGGEKTSPELLSAWHKLGGGRVAWINGYGPTETTITTTLYEPPAGAETEARWSEVPIGTPIANMQVYVLDRHLQPVPIGVPGELYIGGAGLARGYLNRPDLTAERFVPNPFTTTDDRRPTTQTENQEPRTKNQAGQIGSRFSVLGSHDGGRWSVVGGRLYRTGDLARYLPNGDLEFLGRVDHQVKVRGFRIEVAEIEAVLHQHPAVRAAAVLAREDRPGDKRLVAYVIPTTDHRPPTTVEADRETSRQGDSSDTNLPFSSSPLLTVSQSSVVGRQSSVVGELRAFLKEHLPEYMLPSAFVTLESFPLTSNGKVDYGKLPAPSGQHSDFAKDYVAPRSQVERTIAAAWAEVLGVEQVGLYDNFFDLGGHSLLMVRVHSKLRTVLEQEIALLDLFQYPTVSALAEYVSSGRDQPEPPSFQETQVVAKKQKDALQQLMKARKKLNG